MNLVLYRLNSSTFWISRTRNTLMYIVQHTTWYEAERIFLWFCHFFLVGWSFSLSVAPYYFSFGVGVFFLKIDVEYLQYFPIILPLGLFKHRICCLYTLNRIRNINHNNVHVHHKRVITASKMMRQFYLIETQDNGSYLRKRRRGHLLTLNMLLALDFIFVFMKSKNVPMLWLNYQ